MVTGQGRGAGAAWRRVAVGVLFFDILGDMTVLLLVSEISIAVLESVYSRLYICHGFVGCF